jgi:hypothetical protein
MKSQTDLKCELAKTISISKGKPKSGQADKIFSSLKKEMCLYEATCTLTTEDAFSGTLNIGSTSTQNEGHFSTSGIFVTK